MKYGTSSTGIELSSSLMPIHAMPMPSGALTSPMIIDSVSSCRTMRQRPAPSAARMEISRWRTEARASSRFATLEQAISSTSVTAPIIVNITSSTCSGSIHSLSVRARHRPVLVLDGIGGGETGGDRLELLLGLLLRDARLHPGEHGVHRPAVIAHAGVLVGRDGDPEPLVLREQELLGHDADHGVRTSIDGDRPADDRRGPSDSAPSTARG